MSVQVGTQVFSAQLRNVGNYQFQVLEVQPVQYDAPLQLPEYRENSATLIIPVLLAFNSCYQIQM